MDFSLILSFGSLVVCIPLQKHSIVRYGDNGRSENCRPGVEGTLQSKATAVKLMQFLRIFPSDSSWCSWFLILPESHMELTNLYRISLNNNNKIIICC